MWDAKMATQRRNEGWGRERRNKNNAAVHVVRPA